VAVERLFVDANVFLRYLTNDIPSEAEVLDRLLCQAAEGRLMLVTNPMVIAEIVWTLESYYRLSPADIRPKIWAMLSTPGLEIAESELVGSAVDAYVEKNVDFIDAYNALWMKQHGITTICTLDRRHFGRMDGIVLADLDCLQTDEGNGPHGFRANGLPEVTGTAQAEGQPTGDADPH
jgi:predicted nucleic acid-binding protein